MSISKTLKERGANYGEYAHIAEVTQHLKETVRGQNEGQNDAIAEAWDNMSPVARETFDMILHKMARALIGDEGYVDNWHDIAGYAKLAEDRIGNK